MISSSASTTSSEKSEAEKKKDDQPKPPSPKKEPAPPPPPPPAVLSGPAKLKTRSISNDDLLEQRLSKDLNRKEGLSKSHSIPVGDTRSESGESPTGDRPSEINRSYSYEERKKAPAKATPPAPAPYLSTSTITVNSDHSSGDTAPGGVNQITVITSHPPVIVDNSVVPTPPPPPGFGNEIVIVSTSEASADDDEPHSGQSSPSSKIIFAPHDTPKGRKLDESEVLIVSPGFTDTELTIHEDDDESTGLPPRQLIYQLDEEETDAAAAEFNQSKALLDTSHVSVVTLGEEQIKVSELNFTY